MRGSYVFYIYSKGGGLGARGSIKKGSWGFKVLCRGRAAGLAQALWGAG